MKMLKLLTRSRFSALRRGTYIFSRCMSVEPAIKDKAKQEIEEFSTKLKERRVRILKPFKKEFVENLFIGKLDTDVLQFPEISNGEEVNTILEYSVAIENILNHEVNSHKIDATGKIPENVLKRLKDLKLYTMAVPRKYGGLELWESENAFLQEVLGGDPSISHHIAETAGIATSILKLYGTDEQKEKYYTKLASGNSSICFAYLEDGPMVDPESFTNTTATLTFEEDKYLINGKKTWVYNAKSADTIMVFATGIRQDGDLIIPGAILLLFDKNTKGITIQEPYDNVGVRGLEICDVVFDDVEVSADCSVGSFENGFNIFKECLSLGKIAHGAQCCALLKKLLENAIYYCHGNKLRGEPMHELEHIKIRIGKIASLLYAVESLVYFLAGRADEFEKPDLLLESFMVKIFTSEALQEALREYIQIVGPKHYLKGSYLDRFMRDSQYYALCDETNLNLKLTLASMGLIHAGKQKKDFITKLRNPLFFPKFNLKYQFQNKDCVDEPNLTGDVPLNLPACVRYAAENLEYCVERLRYSTQFILEDRAAKSLEDNHDIIILGEMVTQVYALVATISRAVNSVSCGLPDNQLDLMLLKAFSENVKANVKSSALEITQYDLDLVLQRIVGEQAFSHKEYPFVHPLNRNY